MEDMCVFTIPGSRQAGKIRNEPFVDLKELLVYDYILANRVHEMGQTTQLLSAPSKMQKIPSHIHTEILFSIINGSVN
jgi:hypothetical protein